jgi:serine/threonine protein kinase
MNEDYKFMRKNGDIFKVYLHDYTSNVRCTGDELPSELTNSIYRVDKKLKLDKQRSEALKENIYYPKDYKLGSGEFGVVYKVCRVTSKSSEDSEDKYLCDEYPEKCDCNFAMKVVNLFLDGDYQIINPIEMLRVYKKCSQINICLPIEDWWFCENKTKLVIITRILSYDLGKYLKRDALKYQDKFKIISDALAVMLKLHSLDIVHKDTHLGNFMLDESNNLFLIDLDLYEEFNPFDNSKSNIEKFLSGIQNDYTEFIKSLNYTKTKSFEKKLRENYLHGLSFQIQKKIIKGLTLKKSYSSIEEIKNYENVLVTEFTREIILPSAEYIKQEKIFQ